MHMSLHFAPMIFELGCPKIFDMIHFEHGHGRQVKDPFRKTSTRNLNLYEDIITKLETQKIIEDATIYNKEKIQRKKLKKKKRNFNGDFTYITSDDIVFETTCGSNNKQRIYLFQNLSFYTKHKKVNFLNPLITSDAFYNVLASNLRDIIQPRVLDALLLNNER